jgi:hypothetical protein
MLLVWLLILLIFIYFAPELFPKEVIALCRKVLKWIRTSYAKDNGYEQMMKDIGPLQMWEEPFDKEKQETDKSVS